MERAHLLGLGFVLVSALFVGTLGLSWWIVGVVALGVACVASAASAHWLVRARATRRAAARFERAILEQATATTASGTHVPPDHRDRIEALERQFRGALDALRRSNLDRSGRGALHALPWYAIVGHPGAGKSTAVRASGLRFPTMPGGAHAAVRGLGGTRNCDWWLTNDAIVLDTAGRYTSDDDDRDEWLAFLDLLKKHRAPKPLDGLLVAVSIAEVVGASDETAAGLAERIRERLDELVGRLGASVPVYCLFTQSDRIPGFLETFDSLGRVERGRVLGCTIPIDGRAGIETELVARLDRLNDSIDRFALHRMAAEPSVQARERIHAFPAEMRARRDDVIDFVARLFAPSVYHETALLRGVYFTSGTQEPSRAASKSFFLTELFTQVMFHDAQRFRLHGSRGVASRAERTLSAVLVAGSIVLGVAAARSFQLNRELALGLDEVASTVASAQRGTDPSHAAPSALAPLRAHVSAFDHDASHGVPTARRWGFHRGERLGPVTERLYASATRRMLVEPLARDLARTLGEQVARLEGAGNRIATRDHAQLHDDLRDYLRITGPKHPDEPHLDRPLTQSIAIRLAARWASSYAPEAPTDQRAEVAEHVRAYLARVRTEPRSVVPRDAYLVRRARHLLGLTPPVDVAVDRVVARMDALGWDLTLATILGRAPSPLVGSGRVRAAFTARGWEEVVRPLLDGGDDGLLGERWVIDAPGQSRLGPPEAARRCAIRAAYSRRLVEEWKRFLGALRIEEPTDARAALTALEQLTAGRPTPLERLVRVVAHHTQLPEAPTSPDGCAGEGERARGDADVDAAFAGFRRFAVPDVPGHDAGVPASASTLTPMEVYEEQLELVRDALRAYLDSPSSLDALTRRVRQARAEVRALIEAQDVRWRARFDALLHPPVLAVANAAGAALPGARGTAWCAAVARPFGASLRGHYPFVREGADAPLADFVAFYAPTDGIVASYYDSVLATDFLRRGARYEAASRSEAGASYEPILTVFLERSQQITDAVFPSGSNSPRVDFEVRLRPPLGAESSTLVVDDQSSEYRTGSSSWTPMHWPGDGAHRGASLLLRSPAGEARLEREGEWGLFRLLEHAEAAPSDGDALGFAFALGQDGAELVVEIRATQPTHPFVRTDDGQLFPVFRGAGASAPRTIVRGFRCTL